MSHLSSPRTARRVSLQRVKTRLLRMPLSAGLAGLVAVLAGAALSVAPVTVSKTVVQWPAEGASTASTVLLLTNQTPYRFDVSFDAAAVSDAADQPASDRETAGLLLATMDPRRTDAAQLGLVLNVVNDSLVVASAGRSEVVPIDGVGRWQLASDASGISVTADGALVVDWPGVSQPQIDALITSVVGASATSLSASAQVVDDSNSVPSAVKIALMVMLWASLVAALVLLRRDDRMRGMVPATVPSGGSPIASVVRRLRPRVVDVLVVAALGLWVFIGPMTDDDGYYAHMSANYGAAGYVGNYYQMFNQPFTPFTWFWQLLWAWQELGGSSPVWLRLPAYIAACVAWFLTRRLFDRVVSGSHGLLAATGRVLLAVLFVAWWSAYTIGSRPEAVGALAFVIALTLVLRALDRDVLLPAAFGAMAAGLAFAAHPTGAVAFAPVVLAIPSLWRIARARGADMLEAGARTMAVLSVGSVALFAAFADATVHDALTGSARFAAVETPLGWRDEWQRYSLLLAGIPMGSYAKRAVVLISLVALIWFVIVWAADRSRNARLTPSAFALAGWSFALALVALWVTTSKWTHHFGVLASAGPLLVAVVVLHGPRLAARLLPRIPLWLPVVAAASFVPAIVLALRGPNLWAYSWNQFLYGVGTQPMIAGRALASLSIWVAVLLGAVGGAFFIARRRRSPGVALFAPVGVLLTFSLVSTGFLYGTFAAAAVRGTSTYSVGGANLVDPTGSRCLPEKSIEVWDAVAGSDLTPVGVSDVRELDTAEGRALQHPSGAMFDTGVLAPGTRRALDAPPTGSPQVWTSSPSEPGAGAASSDWFALPAALGSSERVTVMVAGKASDTSGNGVLVQVGTESGGVVTVLRETWLTDIGERPGWRTLKTDIGPDDLESGAVMRVVGVDSLATPGDWFGFSAPRLATSATMDALVGDAPSLVSWQSSFWFPCARPITIADGIIEPPAYATTWGNDAPDNIWVERRGGALAGAVRIAELDTPASDMSGVGSAWGRLVLFQYPYATDGYSVTKQPVTTNGLTSPFGPPSQLTPRS